MIAGKLRFRRFEFRLIGIPDRLEHLRPMRRDGLLGKLCSAPLGARDRFLQPAAFHRRAFIHLRRKLANLTRHGLKPIMCFVPGVQSRHQQADPLLRLLHPIAQLAGEGVEPLLYLDAALGSFVNLDHTALGIRCDLLRLSRPLFQRRHASLGGVEHRQTASLHLFEPVIRSTKGVVNVCADLILGAGEFLELHLDRRDLCETRRLHRVGTFHPTQQPLQKFRIRRSTSRGRTARASLPGATVSHGRAALARDAHGDFRGLLRRRGTVIVFVEPRGTPN